MTMSRTLQAIGILVGLAAVVAQFFLAIDRFTGEGMSMGGAVVKFFSFFTILTNIFVVLVHASGAMRSRLAFFRQPRVQATAVIAITIVGIVYHLLLADLWNPQGLQKVTDVMLHYVAPVVMVVWWLLYGRDGALRWADLPVFLIYPFAYLGYALARAPIAGEVPYPFLDFWQNGWPSVITMIAAILAMFVVVAALVIAAHRYLPSSQKAA
jgi:hypothetical protein